MKVLLTLIALTLGSSSFAGEVKVKVSGMVCSMCAQGIKKKFSSRDEVKDLSVDMEKKIVTITTAEKKDLNDEVITKLITEAGYNVADISRK